MIRLSNVRKIYPTSFGDKLVLDDINLELAMGERLGVLGRNGAGKSTMIRLISGAEKPTSGSIERHMSVSWPLAFGGAFQLSLTGRDNVRFISRIYGQDFRRNLAFVEEFSELGQYLYEPVRSYSSGMKARLAFAISMIIEFDCFLIDEIASVGDARFHARCNYELFEKRGDRAMVIISHDAGYVRSSCNRFAVLINGRLTEFGDFDAAYEYYSENIGLLDQTKQPAIKFTTRSKALESSYHVAIADEAFRVHTQQGDWARDSGQWANSEKAYRAALALHPYERSYWTQLGHVLREQGKFMQAEIAYRTSAALGVPRRDLNPYLELTLTGQGLAPDQFPLATLKEQQTFAQPPAEPDIDVLSEWLWQSQPIPDAEKLAIMRSGNSLDDLVCQMLADSRAVRSEPDHRPEFDSFARICSLSGAMPDLTDKDQYDKLPGDFDLLNYLNEHGAFADWPGASTAFPQEIPESRTGHQ